MGRNRTEVREHKDIKKGVKARSRSGCLKKGGGGDGWNSLTNYEEIISVFRQNISTGQMPDRLSLARPSRGERSITITVSTNQSFSYNNFEI